MKNIKNYKKSIGYDKRWSEIGNDKKDPILDLLMYFNYCLFQYRKYQEILYGWLEERQSDLKCVGSNLYVQSSKKIPEHINIEIKGHDTIVIGHYRLRFKAEGGKIKPSWKINVEFNR